MIQATVFTHTHYNGVGGYIIEEGDIRIVGLLEGDSIEISDWDPLYAACQNVENLKPSEWYILTFKREYEDDGSGFRGRLWFDLIESEIVPYETVL